MKVLKDETRLYRSERSIWPLDTSGCHERSELFGRALFACRYPVDDPAVSVPFCPLGDVRDSVYA